MLSENTTASTPMTPHGGTSKRLRGGSIGSLSQTIDVVPWKLTPHDSHSVFRVLDERFLRLLQSAVRDVYLLIDKRFDRLSHTEQEQSKGFHAMFVQSRRPCYRSFILPKFKQRTSQYLEFRDRSPLVIPYGNSFTLNVVPDRNRVSQNGMPFTLPVSVLREDLVTIFDKGRFWFWFPKSDGLRMVWVFATVGTQKISFWMDRKGQAWLVPVPDAPDSFYRGTMWDGEVVPLDHQKGSAFLAWDCLMANGRTCGEYESLVRVQNAHNLLERWRTTHNTFPMAYSC